MNLVDSCGWLEYFADGRNASFFESAILNTKELIVPSICIYEVYKKIKIEKDESMALLLTAQMQQAKIINLNQNISILAADLSIEKKMPMADSIILATAIISNAIIWTQDEHFANVEGVRYIR